MKNAPKHQERVRPFATNNCAINEVAGDGRPVGRCWFSLAEGDRCPRHGDVSGAMKRYRDTGRLTLESLEVAG